jgi:hypothetical protein
MNIVSAFRALDYDLKTYGFWPQDLIAVLLIFVLVHGIFNSLTLDLIGVGPLFYAAWRARRRPPVYLRSMFFFASTAKSYGVGRSREALSR